MIVHFVRHAPAAGADGHCIGQTDLPLSRISRDALPAVAASWNLAGIEGLQCISSDLRRARETAALLAPSLLHIDTEPRLREMNFGEWDGRTWDDIERTEGAGLESWMADWTTVRAPGGESFADVVERVRDLLAAIPRRDDGTTLIVAHAGSIRAAAVVLLGLPASRAFSLAVEHLRLHSFALSATSSTL
ncbi:MAG TPA: histidine phosphatase family protein, partial [Gemmatimonadaceae bacterium]|nr:histidine phosphatase family protein [Gemmatimonadaceae bacterium]